MEKITAIKQQVKNPQRYSIFVDEKYSFSLSELALINSELKIGQEVQVKVVEIDHQGRINLSMKQAAEQKGEESQDKHKEERKR